MEDEITRKRLILWGLLIALLGVMQGATVGRFTEFIDILGGAILGGVLWAILWAITAWVYIRPRVKIV